MVWRTARPPSASSLRRSCATAVLAVLALTWRIPPAVARDQAPRGQPQLSALPGSAQRQIAALLADKRARGGVQRKIASRLLYRLRMTRGQSVAAGVQTLRVQVPTTTDGRAILDVRAPVTLVVLDALRALGAEITDTDSRFEHIGLSAPLDRIESIAALPEVQFVAPQQRALIAGRGSAPAGAAPAPLLRHAPSLRDAVTRALQQPGPVVQIGSINSQGDLAHGADAARGRFGVSGAGVKIGILSDGVDSLASSQATGELGPVTVLPGQAGAGNEGTAMLEIVHDLAPGAQLFFATAIGDPTVFARNIRDLRAAGCDIIVDDVLYFSESPFQDGQIRPTFWNGGVVIQAVKDVAASGALYFSSAGNSGSLDAGTSGTWEGDFVDGGVTSLEQGGRLHNFGGATFDTLTATDPQSFTTLHWSDPLGASGNDYDLFLLDSGGNVVDVSADDQSITLDPFEIMSPGVPGDRIVIVKFSGQGRFLHLATNGGTLSIRTAGQTHGHAATTAPNSFGVAATRASSTLFTSANRVEPFSSDGPRRIFYAGDGTALTPNNVTSSGGLVLRKPDLAAADGVSTSVTGFAFFFGTSAAAPHAAAIAALVKSANPALSPPQVRSALLATAIDIQGPGDDRDSGAGIVMALPAVTSVFPPSPPAAPSSVRVTRTGPSTAVVTWSAVSTAVSYNVRVSVAGGLLTMLTNTTATSAAIAGLSRGQTYVFIVSALNTAGDGAGTASAPLVIPIVDPRDDIDGDFVGDIMVWRASTGTWFWLSSSSGFAPISTRSQPWGSRALGDVPLTGDIDGDGKVDLVVWRASTGTWFWLTSSSGYSANAAGSRQWGASGDVPLLDDLDGDGKADLVIWRPADGTFYWLTSSTAFNYANARGKQWGSAALGDRPFLGDVDGDRRADLVVWRAADGTWYYLRSTTGYEYSGAGAKQWGASSLGDVPLLGDLDGDGRVDLTVWRATTGTWFWLSSSTGFEYGSARSAQWGSDALGDVPLLGDLDGDGKADLTVWRASTGTWFWISSLHGFGVGLPFGSDALGDVPRIR